ncbi:MAG: methyl-accepting chemotaxis protein, partial [Curvibacter sp.]
MGYLNRVLGPGIWLMHRLPLAGKLLVLLGGVLLALGIDHFWGLAAGLVVLAALAYLMLAFYTSFMADLRRVMHVMEQTARGNLREPIQLQGSDEVAAMAGALKTMVGSLSSMVASIRSNSALVAHAGQSLAAGNRELSDRTEQQAANLEQTSASVQELSSTVQGNAGTTQQANSRAAQVRDVADRGAQAMAEAVRTVEASQGSAQRMNEIIGVIDGLAFQTNILALNAAVEAARAG